MTTTTTTSIIMNNMINRLDCWQLMENRRSIQVCFEVSRLQEGRLGNYFDYYADGDESDDDYQDNYEDDDMDGCDYQNYRFKISLRQGLYWICPSWGFDSRSASLLNAQILRTKYEVKKTNLSTLAHL